MATGPSGATLGYAGQHGRSTETSLALTPTQMGARVYLPTIGRFAQVDPIPGGNANDYAYATDPVNSHDFSGRCLQCASGAGFVQNAAPTQRVQATSPAQYFQPAVSMRAVQTIRKVNLPIVRPAAPKRNDAGRMPVASVNAIGYLTSAKKASDAKLYAASGPDEGYTKITFGANYFAGGGLGVVVTNQGKIYLLGYVAAAAIPGLDGSIMTSTTPIQCGWSASASYGYGLAQSVGSDGSSEVGLATKGVSTESTYVKC